MNPAEYTIIKDGKYSVSVVIIKDKNFFYEEFLELFYDYVIKYPENIAYVEKIDCIHINIFN